MADLYLYRAICVLKAYEVETIQLKLPRYSPDETSVTEPLRTAIQTLTEHHLFILICLQSTVIKSQIPVTARSEGVGSEGVRLLRLWVRIPLAAWMSLSVEGCVLSAKGLCDGLISYPDKSVSPGVSKCNNNALYL
jgi:hypothetical protein